MVRTVPAAFDTSAGSEQHRQDGRGILCHKFTSAVERDPNTSRVKKVVKRLVVNGVNAQRFIHGFKREAQRHRHTVTNRKNDETTITMVADDKKATRVYLLKYDDRAYHFSDATITIVIVPK